MRRAWSLHDCPRWPDPFARSGGGADGAVVDGSGTSLVSDPSSSAAIGAAASSNGSRRDIGTAALTDRGASGGHDGAAAVVLRGVDRAVLAVSFAARLRAAGIPVVMTQTESFTRALAVAQPRTQLALYWLARTTLLSSHLDLAVFDAVFRAVFADAVQLGDPIANRMAGPPPVAAPEDKHSRPISGEADEAVGPSLPWATRPQAVGMDDGPPDDDLAISVPELLPSEIEHLSDTPFDELSDVEIRRLGEWLSSVLADWPTRRSRRRRKSPHGRHLALGPTMAQSRRTGFEPIRLVHSQPVIRPRRVVMICDVSQSMAAYTSAYLHVMRGLVQRAEAEVFAFSTRLTRLTPALAHRSTIVALETATEAVEDRFSGTRIARSLNELLRSHHGGTVRGAIVLIASDGWDVDDPEAMERVMARLARRAHQVVWINPRMGAEDYQPLVGAMAAALPHCDQVFAGHTITNLKTGLARLH